MDVQAMFRVEFLIRDVSLHPAMGPPNLHFSRFYGIFWGFASSLSKLPVLSYGRDGHWSYTRGLYLPIIRLPYFPGGMTKAQMVGIKRGTWKLKW